MEFAGNAEPAEGPDSWGVEPAEGPADAAKDEARASEPVLDEGPDL